MLSEWGDIFVEGDVYRITFFHLISNLGPYRATDHEYKLLFIPKTIVVPTESHLIPMWGLTPRTSEQLNNAGNNGQVDFLADMVGLLTAVSEDTIYVKSGKVTTMKVLELTDDMGKIDCVVFGEHVRIISNYLTANGAEKPVIVVQLGKLKIYKGKTVLQTIRGASRIGINPAIAEVVSFRAGICLHGYEMDEPVDYIASGAAALPIRDEFMNMHQVKNIASLKQTIEEGHFIILAKVVALLEDDIWSSSKCECDNDLFLGTLVQS